MNNIMLDLECLDSNSNAAIVSIGAVKFDTKKQELGEEFYMEISLSSIKGDLRNGATQSLDTMIWWMQQDKKVIEVFNKKDNQDTITAALVEFSNYCGKDACIWGNGVDYDNVVLRNAYKRYSIPCPFQYRTNRCYRTIKALFGNKAKLERVEPHHNALSDAKTQALHLMRMLK